MLLILYIILLLLIILTLLVFLKKFTWLSYKVVFLVIFVVLIISGFLFARVVSKVLKTPKIIENHISNSKEIQDELNSDSENYKKKTTIIVGTTADFFPWTYKDNNSLKGYNIDLLKQAVKLMGKKIKFIYYKNDEAMYKALNQKEIDIIADLTPIENNNNYTYSMSIVDPPFVFIVKDNNPNFKNHSYNNINNLIIALENKTVAVLDKDYLTTYLSDILKKSKIITLGNNTEVIKGVTEGKYDVGFTEYFTLLSYNNKNPKNHLIVLQPFLSGNLNKGLSFVINNSEVQLSQQLDIALCLLKRRGVMSNLSIQYFKEDVTL